MISMTYGTLPLRERFEEAFEAACPDGTFRFGNCKRMGTGNFSPSEVWGELQKAVKEGSDEALDWASGVLDILGYDWV